MIPQVDLIVPLKPPRAGKSRLRGRCASGAAEREHGELVLAIARDTLSAARSTSGIRRVVVVTSEAAALGELAELDVELLDENGTAELNPALRYAESVLRERDKGGVIGVLQADLPALRRSELRAAIAEAGGERAFVADRHGSGTTLLLSAPGAALSPCFGPDSARAHAASGAVSLRLAAPSLRADVDTPADLAHAATLGLGDRTAARIPQPCVVS